MWSDLIYDVCDLICNRLDWTGIVGHDVVWSGVVRSDIQYDVCDM